MDDMNAFENQVGREVVLAMGPLRPVDDAAILTAITATRSPEWRVQSLFSASKFVVAAAIVALFGGILLVGVSTTHVGEEQAPAVGASASPWGGTEYAVNPVAKPTSAYPSVVTDDALWLVDQEGRAVFRVDAETGAVTELSLETTPGYLVASADAIWMVRPFGVHRIDRASLTVDDAVIQRSGGAPFSGESGSPQAAIVADGSLWIAVPDGETDALVEIDLATRRMRAEYPASTGAGFYLNAPWLGAIDDAIWMYSNGWMSRFDLPTRTFTDAVEVPAVNGTPIASEDAIWLSDPASNPDPYRGILFRFDTDTLGITDTLELGVELRGGIAAADAIWLGTLGTDGQAVYRIDPSTREVTDVIPVSRTWHFAVFDGALWTGSGGGGRTLTRIDVDTRRVIGTLDMPDTHMEDAPFPSETVMWVQTYDAGRLFRVDRVAATE